MSPLYIFQTCHTRLFPLASLGTFAGLFPLRWQHPSIIFAYYNLTVFEGPAQMLSPSQNLTWLSQGESISPSPGLSWDSFMPVITVYLVSGLIYVQALGIKLIQKTTWAFLAGWIQQVAPWLWVGIVRIQQDNTGRLLSVPKGHTTKVIICPLPLLRTISHSSPSMPNTRPHPL